MAPSRILVRSKGFSLLEVLLVTSIVATLAAVSIPVTAGALEELRTSMAARYLEGRIMNARATAVRRSTRIGLRFEPVGNDWRIGEYADGNGNGVRVTDIASGLDPEVAQAEFIGSLFPGVGFGLHSGVPDVDGSRSSGPDGLRIGSSGILTLGPDGTATSGTLYVQGRRGQYAVRILGITGRTRVLRFHPGTGQWTTN
jgi:prepilin-type N-terminal cleavage/methylation domain-containing protein